MPPAPSSPVPGQRALGIDLGAARVGIALSDALGMFAHPRETIRVPAARGVETVLARIVEIAAQEIVGVIVVGLPRNMDGSDGPAATKAREFADRLRAATSCEVRLLDERLTTVAAQKALHASGRNVKNSRAVIDQVAAQMILQIYLDGETLRQSAHAQPSE